MTTAIDTTAQARIKEIVCDVLELEEDEVTDSSLFKEDHGADSLRAIEILAGLEKEFKVTIEQSELERMVNLDGVYAVVGEAVAAQK
ncbi:MULTISPECIES: acyl carrier protein [Streptomyces]|jgi:acyl carrier protein|uniref:Acyl carrier protein n=2 Tax=Streptomyces TaxID=1883 RepID=A0A0N7FMV5_9ACTN|nr:MULTISPECIES: acyl carrier protein [Streptomyces]ALG65307.1 Cal29 [Streptomyces calvus]MBA8943009.1 acyl carrier protein [Streptomyces calvus]MBA8978706.1 acyl carrier protein [Streptomyces calvus]MYS29502.1 acyl carrier protein [Streptomyces sp. SID7804]QDI71399.1 polyketide-8 synthase acyl carrier protein [Streptomyces calvus]